MLRCSGSWSCNNSTIVAQTLRAVVSISSDVSRPSKIAALHSPRRNTMSDWCSTVYLQREQHMSWWMGNTFAWRRINFYSTCYGNGSKTNQDYPKGKRQRWTTVGIRDIQGQVVNRCATLQWEQHNAWVALQLHQLQSLQYTGVKDRNMFRPFLTIVLPDNGHQSVKNLSKMQFFT